MVNTNARIQTSKILSGIQSTREKISRRRKGPEAKLKRQAAGFKPQATSQTRT